MQKHWWLNIVRGLGALLVVLAACQTGAPLTLGQIPLYPGATELPPTTENIDEAILQNAFERDAAYRRQIGADKQVGQKRLVLPENSDSVEIMRFYSGKMNGLGWSPVWGAVPGWHAYRNGSQTLIIQIATGAEGGGLMLMTLNEP